MPERAAQTAERSKCTEKSAVNDALRLAGVLLTDAFDLGVIVSIVFGRYKFNIPLELIGALRRDEH
jgi:hypothetical protein